MRKMKSVVIPFVSAVCAAINGLGQSVVVPSGSGNVDGNSYSFVGPAVNQPQTIRYQQVYSASEFMYLTNFGGGWLFDVLFRGDATNGIQVGLSMPSAQVNVSTSRRGPDELSAVFSENVGPDDTVVHSGSLVANLVGGHRAGPETWNFLVAFSKNLFFYNPTAGNLLLDFQILEGNTNFSGMTPTIVFDAVNVTSDAVSRVWWGDVNATTGVVDTVGLPTQMFFWPNPKLNVQLKTNFVVISWPFPGLLSAPLQTVLQLSEGLGPQVQWQDVSNGIVTSNFVNYYTIPFESAGAAAYFRLVSTTPP
jgi:hypothetical protein